MEAIARYKKGLKYFLISLKGIFVRGHSPEAENPCPPQEDASA
jgi:hypothetical protein